jgi:hypothetical protein
MNRKLLGLSRKRPFLKRGKVSIGCSQSEPPTAHRYRATVGKPDRTGLSRKGGSVILPGEGGLTAAHCVAAELKIGYLKPSMVT